MTPEKIKLVQDSFAKVAPIAGAASDIFYDRLFETAPEVRKLFPAEMADQKGKLMQMLGAAVNGLNDLDALVPVVQDLGRRHVDYGTKAEHYDVVGASLLFTLEKGLGDDWNPELAEAWTETYTLLASVMKDAAAEVEPKKKGFFARLMGAA